jgi:hypothetical protein
MTNVIKRLLPIAVAVGGAALAMAARRRASSGRRFGGGGGTGGGDFGGVREPRRPSPAPAGAAMAVGDDGDAIQVR